MGSPPSQSSSGAAREQVSWHHGFGGMGKSWFLKRARLCAVEQFPEVVVAYVDWDKDAWRQPLDGPPERTIDMLTLSRCEWLNSLTKMR